MIAILYALALGLTPADTSRLLDAIEWVESKGDVRAVGDKNKRHWSRGPFCITEPYWIDAVQKLRWEGKKRLAGSLKYKRDVWNKVKSRIIIKAYWRRYAPKRATMEQLARQHNGGPKGHLRKSTIKYWRKVQRALKRKAG